MRKTLVVISVVAAACSPADDADPASTSTPIADSTSSTVNATTSTSSPAVTATTATGPTTTTAATTTSESSVEGNWADSPLITTDFGALGWWDGDGWLDAETAGALPVTGGEDYQVARLGEVSVTTGGPQTTVCEPLDLIGIDLADPDLLGEYPGPYGVAISAPWELQPHLFEAISDDGSYSGFVAELLSADGLDVPDPVIKQLFRTDLDGDGVNEVLIVAEEVSPGLLLEVGDYSISLMRRVIEDGVQTVVLGETVVLDESERFGGAYGIGGVADLNGDGHMELITNTAFFEGFSVAIWEYANDEFGPVQVLETGCGS